MGGDVAGDPVRRKLGVSAGTHHGLEIVGHRPLIGEHSCVVLGETQLIGVAMPLCSRQFGQFSAPGLPLIRAHLNRAEVGIREVAVIAGAFLAAHALGELLALIPEAGLLNDRLTGFVGLDLTLDLVLAGLLDGRERVHVLDLHLRSEGRIRPPTHGDVDVTTQGSLLHVAVAHPQVPHDPADLRCVFGRFTAGAQVRLADDFRQGHTGPVVVHERMGGTRQAVAAGMHQLAGVLLHVQTLDADGLQVGVLAFFSDLHLDPALLGDRLVVLGDLVVLRQIWIEVLLAVELAVFGDVEVQRHRCLHGVLEHLLVQHRQCAGQTAHHRVDVGVGVITKGGGRRRENFAVRSQLHVGLETDHGLPGRLGCCVGHAPVM